MTIQNKINQLLLKTTGMLLTKPYPKHAIKFAKEYFKDKNEPIIQMSGSQCLIVKTGEPGP